MSKYVKEVECLELNYSFLQKKKFKEGDFEDKNLSGLLKNIVSVLLWRNVFPSGRNGILPICFII